MNQLRLLLVKLVPIFKEFDQINIPCIFCQNKVRMMTNRSHSFDMKILSEIMAYVRPYAAWLRACHITNNGF